MTSYLRPQHFHSILLADASCSLLGNNQRNELHSFIFTALHTKVSSSTKNTFQNVDIVLKFMTEFDKFLTLLSVELTISSQSDK